MNIYHIEENSAIHVFYEKEREFVNAENKCLSIEVKFKEGYSYVSPHDQARCKAYGDDTTYYVDDRCNIYAFVNYYLTSHPDHTDMDIVDSLICNIDGEEFSISSTPYPGLMYQDILSTRVLEPPESLKGKIERFSLFCFISISYKRNAHNSLKQRDLICRTFVVLLSPLTSKMSPQKDIV